VKNTYVPNHARPWARKALNLAGPALVVGLLLVSRSYGLVVYPHGAPGRLERSIDVLLAKEQADILRENRLVTTQNSIGNVLDILNQKLQNATDPNQIAQLQQQIAAKEMQYQNFQRAIDANGQILVRDLTVVNPAKDNALSVLGGMSRPRKQIEMFITAATQRERTYVTLIQTFLRSHPVTPIAPL